MNILDFQIEFKKSFFDLFLPQPSVVIEEEWLFFGGGDGIVAVEVDDE